MSDREPLVRVSDIKTRLDCDTFASCRQFHLHLKYLIWFNRSSRRTHTQIRTHAYSFLQRPRVELRVFCLASSDDSEMGGVCSGKALFEAEEAHGTGRNKEL